MTHMLKAFLSFHSEHTNTKWKAHSEQFSWPIWLHFLAAEYL